MKYRDILKAIYGEDLSLIPHRLLSLDPGETTGFSLFEQGFLVKHGEIRTVKYRGDVIQDKNKYIDWPVLADLFVECQPTCVVCENYRIYAHKLDRHSYSQVETLRVIGGIDMLCNLNWNGDGITPIYYTMAAQAKGFVDDNKLKEWGFWIDGERHSRDSIRHGLYHIIVTNRPSK